MSDSDERPLPPGDSECCESGCDTCVWDIYNAELKQWQVRKDAQKEEMECNEKQEDNRTN